MVISATVRDLAIIIVAIQSIVIGLLLAILIWQIWRLAKMMQIEIKPIIEDTQETVSTIRGTTTFVGDNVVAPIVRTNRSIARARGTIRALTNEISAWRNPLAQDNDGSGASPPQSPPRSTPGSEPTGVPSSDIRESDIPHSDHPSTSSPG